MTVTLKNRKTVLIPLMPPLPLPAQPSFLNLLGDIRCLTIASQVNRPGGDLHTYPHHIGAIIVDTFDIRHAPVDLATILKLELAWSEDCPVSWRFKQIG